MNYSLDDFIGVFHDAAPKTYCEEVIKYFDEMSSAGLSHNRSDYVSKLIIDDSSVALTGEDIIILDGTKTIIHNFYNLFWNNCYNKYAEKYRIVKECGAQDIYGLKVQKTTPGQGYHGWHFESSERRVSHRVMAFILYLNDVEEGGETEFLYYPRRIKPTTGTVLLFPASYTHTHRGNQPLSGEKYIITGWIEF